MAHEANTVIGAEVDAAVCHCVLYCFGDVAEPQVMAEMDKALVLWAVPRDENEVKEPIDWADFDSLRSPNYYIKCAVADYCVRFYVERPWR